MLKNNYWNRILKGETASQNYFLLNKSALWSNQNLHLNKI
jgi:hypothetical protein